MASPACVVRPAAAPVGWIRPPGNGFESVFNGRKSAVLVCEVVTREKPSEPPYSVVGGVPARVLSVAYVVIREALANAAKHADGRNVTVTLAAGDQDLVVVVGDAGRGFTREEESAARDAHHVGLDLLRRRVGEVGGRLRIESRPGKGTRVIARLPMHGVAS